jgi:hypothetical protein
MILKVPTVGLVPGLSAQPTLAEEVMKAASIRTYQCELALSLASLSLDRHGTPPTTIAFLS